MKDIYGLFVAIGMFGIVLMIYATFLKFENETKTITCDPPYMRVIAFPGHPQETEGVCLCVNPSPDSIELPKRCEEG